MTIAVLDSGYSGEKVEQAAGGMGFYEKDWKIMPFLYDWSCCKESKAIW